MDRIILAKYYRYPVVNRGHRDVFLEIVTIVDVARSGPAGLIPENRDNRQEIIPHNLPTSHKEIKTENKKARTIK